MEFDLEKAKQGEIVEYRYLSTNRYEEVYFIGVSKSGDIVIQTQYNNLINISTEFLRMRPKKIQKWVNFYPNSSYTYYNTEEAANSAASKNRKYGKAFLIEYEE